MRVSGGKGQLSTLTRALRVVTCIGHARSAACQILHAHCIEALRAEDRVARVGMFALDVDAGAAKLFAELLLILVQLVHRVLAKAVRRRHRRVRMVLQEHLFASPLLLGTCLGE